MGNITCISLVKSCCEIVTSDIRTKQQSGETAAEEFFKEWFVRKSQPYFFLFNQNVRSTNIQYGELISLLRIHTFCEELKPVRPDFSNSAHFKRVLADQFDSTKTNEWTSDAFIKRLAQYLENRIVVEAYFGSCGVYLPPTIDISAGAICGEAGYIHSVGRIIALRNATKLTQVELAERVTEFTEKQADKRPVFIVPYCHEDFSNLDRETPFLKHGLNDIKLHLAKSSLGNEPLAQELEQLAQHLKGLGIRAAVAQSGNYKEARDAFAKEMGVDVTRTWFWIIESEIAPNERTPSDKKFYVLYEQLLRNQNFYHWFDENKPAWVSHTTLPHSLCAAMINVTRPWWPIESEISVCDPFGGSGTTFLEAQRLFNCEVRSYDIAAAAKRITEDNLSAFSQSVDWYTRVISELEELIKLLDNAIGFVDSGVKSGDAQKIREFKDAADSIIEATGGDCLKAADADWLKILPKGNKNDLAWRIKLYVFLRGYLRHKSGIQRGTEHPHLAIKNEAEQLVTAFKGVRNIFQEKKSDEKLFPAGILGMKSDLELFPGRYSHAVRPARPKPADEDLFGNRNFEQRDVRKLPRETFDVIVCDPPYGFNTDEEMWELAKLYTDMIGAMISAIKRRGGQIVIAVPEESFTGKPIPFFARPRFVIDDFFRLLRELGRTAKKPAVLSPTKSSPYEPPYYWYSEKALKRAILHFWIEPS